ncbi:PREDICTED: centrosomal protein of 95 kDa [Gekko japonicus]|uniref:Centrosomal protein of 95 kDa n=1 Tax=Gekko japonicus TaxID=146911 RepID=A0ABM1KZJ2_GEKJA|nr:PREDICTED: centrosomal protein of 95 kDa [Gekko japonicus]
MGGPEETEWVNVVNSLLAKCNIDLHVTDLFDCGAKVFISLYESVLGEKVPDLIAEPRCQEDDAHNVQAIIDSLAMDYLQISLSHITGENIVKGDRESIRNLLEIFDGLFEYLTEEISETASEGGTEWKNTANGTVNLMAQDEIRSVGLEEVEGGSAVPFPPKKLPSVMGSSQSSDIFIPSGEVEGSESTSELIKLGDTAYLFSLRNDELPASKGISRKTTEPEEPAASAETSSIPPSSRKAFVTETEGSAKTARLPSEQLSSSAKKLGEPIRSAVALQPPYQPSVPRPPYQDERGTRNSDRCPALTKSQGLSSSELPLRIDMPSRKLWHALMSGRSISSHKKPFRVKLMCGFLLSDLSTGGDEPGAKVVIKEPDVADELVPEDSVDDVGKETDENVQYKPTSSVKEDRSQRFTSIQSTRPKQKNLFNGKRQHESSITDSLAEVSLSHSRIKEKLSDQELQQMSEKLSHRLNELDAMLKNALSERSRGESSTDEDRLSQHSDSVMDYHDTKQEPATWLPKKTPSRQRSFSASPPPSTHKLSSELEDAFWRDGKGPTGKIRNHLQKEHDQRKLRAKLLTKAYEDELRAYEASERIELAKQKAKIKEMEQLYKESLFKEPPSVSRPAEVYSRKTVPRNLKLSQRISRGGFVKPKKAAPMKVKENNLLPLLMEEFPHLHISRPTMNKMWQQQLAQIELLKSPSNRTQLKLQNEVVEALKKHDLLVELIKKEQAHNKRLQDFKQRIHYQKCGQNKMRERHQQIIRAKKYYQDYRIQLRAKMMRARTREERIFKNLFEEGLDIQKRRLHELRMYAKDKRAEQMRHHQAELESMENYYKDQFSMLAEAVSEERKQIEARERAHAQTLNKVKCEFRSKMENEIQELQDVIIQNDDDSFFRELEADRLRSRLQMASFQYSKNCHFF